MNFSNRLQARMRALHLSATEISSRISVSKGTITHWTNGTNKAGGENLLKLAHLLECDPIWLSLGKGQPPADGSIAANVEPGPDIKGLLPLISWTQAGHWHAVADPYTASDTEAWIACPTNHGPRTFVLRVRGESMLNHHARHSFRPGDLIFVDPDRPAENGSMVVVKLDGAIDATFKQLVIEDETRYLKALNPSWPDPIIKLDQSASICGVVIGKFDPI
jgi:SOS-response transcriptional repressor LexA